MSSTPGKVRVCGLFWVTFVIHLVLCAGDHNTISVTRGDVQRGWDKKLTIQCCNKGAPLQVRHVIETQTCGCGCSGCNKRASSGCRNPE